MKIRLKNGKGINYNRSILGFIFLVVAFSIPSDIHWLLTFAIHFGLIFIALDAIIYRSALWIGQRKGYIAWQLLNWFFVYATFAVGFNFLLAQYAGFAIPYYFEAASLYIISALLVTLLGDKT